MGGEPESCDPFVRDLLSLYFESESRNSEADQQADRMHIEGLANKVEENAATATCTKKTNWNSFQQNDAWVERPPRLMVPFPRQQGTRQRLNSKGRCRQGRYSAAWAPK